MDPTIKDPLQRAIAFSKSKKYIDLVKEANDKGIIVEMDDIKTIIRRETDDSASAMITEWRCDEPDSEEFIFKTLQAQVKIYDEN